MHAHGSKKAETNTQNLTKLNSAISKVIKKENKCCEIK